MGPSLDCFVLTAAMRDARDIGLLVTVCRVERLQIPPSLLCFMSDHIASSPASVILLPYRVLNH